MESAISSGLGFVYQLLGQPDIALSYNERSLDLISNTDDRRGFALQLAAVGRLDGELGRKSSARDRLTRAVDLAFETGSTSVQVRTLAEFGRFEVSQGDPQNGLEMIRRAVGLLTDTSPSIAASVLHAEAVALRQLGRIEESQEVLESALDPALVLDDPLILGSIHALLGELLRLRGDLDGALENLEEAVKLHEQIRARIVDPWQRATFVSRRYDHFQALIELLMELDSRRPGQGFAVRAFTTSERLRARSLVELLSEARVDVRQKVSEELRQREKNLALRIALLQSELLTAAADEESEEVDSASLRAALETAVLDQEQLTLEIRDSWQAYASLRYPEPLDLADIQGSLAPDEALMHFSLGPARSFLFDVRRDSLSVRELPPAAEIDAMVDSIRAALEATDPRSTQGVRASSRILAARLFGPALADLADLDRLIIVPDSSLFLLPFEVLSSDDGLLVERLTITYVPSANVIGLLPTAGDHGASFVAFAGVTGEPAAPATGTRQDALRSLPGTVDEVEAIARLVHDGAHLYLGLDAHQGNLFDNPEVTQAQWLHFASHALLLEGSRESAILLSPDEKGDRLLQISEVFNLDLNAEVVVLSACETAIGRTLRGDGMIGLARAFFYAGTPNLVVSLWPVDDRATARFMEFFYTHLADGLPPDRSLRQAKLDLIRTTHYRSPRFWAPFILLGAPHASGNVTTPTARSPVASGATFDIELKEGER